MPLPTPNLDNRTFQQIVDEAKGLIPRYCPEWTDHNVSDPGVTLIELFAWMTDMLLYRVNKVPDMMYVRFLELIGIRLEPPRPAQTAITFYLSAAQPTDITIGAETEVATVRTETTPSIIFTTEADLTIRKPILIGALTRRSSKQQDPEWIQHDLRHFETTGRQTSIFHKKPGPGDAFYLGFSNDLSRHVLALVLDCDLAGGAGIDPRNPPIEWQVWQGGVARWVNCEVEWDGTGGFNRSGEIILHLPLMAEHRLHTLSGYWLRCRLTDAQAREGSYEVSPSVRTMRVESRGGTVNARHATTVRNEYLGISDGTAAQTFKLMHAPVLSRDPEQDYIVVTLPDGGQETYHEVRDFADSDAEDRVFTLDSIEGEISLGPSLLQPDGRIYSFGAIPPKGSVLRFSRYQHGGGIEGNVPTDTLTVLKTSIPYVAQVTNRRPAVGGRNAQTLEDAKLRAPQTLRTRTRAVTAEDYEFLAMQVPGVARAKCLAPGAQPGDPTDLKPGQVFVIVLPEADLPLDSYPPEQLVPSAELRSAVLQYLEERRLIGTTLEVRGPQYIWVSVHATLVVQEGIDPETNDQIRRRAETELYRYLNPFVGGPRQDGWTFGRDLHSTEIYSLLQRVPGVEFVGSINISVTEPGGSPAKAAPTKAPPRIAVPRHGLICSSGHQVIIT